MRHRHIILISLGGVLLLSALAPIGLRVFSKVMPFRDPIADATTDVAQYPSLLTEWRKTGLAKHFPNTIPKSAQSVRLSAFPGGGQGGRWFQLRLQLPPAEVASIKAYAATVAGKVHTGGGGEFDHVNADAKNGWPTAGFHTGDDPSKWEFPTHYTMYVITATTKGGPSWDPYDGAGIAISESTNEVVFWASQ